MRRSRVNAVHSSPIHRKTPDVVAAAAAAAKNDDGDDDDDDDDDEDGGVWLSCVLAPAASEATVDIKDLAAMRSLMLSDISPCSQTSCIQAHNSRSSNNKRWLLNPATGMRMQIYHIFHNIII